MLTPTARTAMEAFYWVLIYFAAFDILFLLLNQATFKNISIIPAWRSAVPAYGGVAQFPPKADQPMAGTVHF